MSASPAPRTTVPTLIERIRQCNAESIRRSGDLDIPAVVAIIDLAFDDLRTREAALLEIATFLASHLDDGAAPQ